jgi:hypothetical protein
MEPIEIASPELERLARRAGVVGAYAVVRLRGGGNNKVYRLDTAGRPLLLKEYFHSRGDPRDRLGTEFSFARYAWDNGVHAVPEPLASDPAAHLGLYEFVPGRQLRVDEITAAHVRQALNFYLDINRARQSCTARQLNAASEACFSLEEHLHAAGWRIARLQSITARLASSQDSIDREAGAFVENELVPRWEAVSRYATQRAAALTPSFDAPLPANECRLSPSDFGFHNALLDERGGLRFVDFEYAGWDDPAKVVCDFFCHVAVPVSMEHFPSFCRTVVADLPRPEWHAARVALLMAVHRLKWCGIMLNEFLPVASDRRRFAHDRRDEQERKAHQFTKTRAYLGSLGETNEGSSAWPMLIS